MKKSNSVNSVWTTDSCASTSICSKPFLWTRGTFNYWPLFHFHESTHYNFLVHQIVPSLSNLSSIRFSSFKQQTNDLKKQITEDQWHSIETLIHSSQCTAVYPKKIPISPGSLASISTSLFHIRTYFNAKICKIERRRSQKKRKKKMTKKTEKRCYPHRTRCYLTI